MSEILAARIKKQKIRIDELEEKLKSQDAEMKRMRKWIETGLYDVVMQVVKENIDVSVTEKTDDEKLAELMKK